MTTDVETYARYSAISSLLSIYLVIARALPRHIDLRSKRQTSCWARGDPGLQLAALSPGLPKNPAEDKERLRERFVSAPLYSSVLIELPPTALVSPVTSAKGAAMEDDKGLPMPTLSKERTLTSFQPERSSSEDDLWAGDERLVCLTFSAMLKNVPNAYVVMTF